MGNILGSIRQGARTNGEKFVRQAGAAGKHDHPNYPAERANTGREVTGDSKHAPPSEYKPHDQAQKTRMQAADATLRQKMYEQLGGGGPAGVEYEDGLPTSMRRAVRNNMFRYI